MSGNPFEVPPAERDPARRFRGRLVAPVTVWTAGRPGATGSPARAGITVSSLMVAEGDPAEVIGLVGPLTDFWEAAAGTGRFVVHVLGAGQVRLADQFAGRYPADPFEAVEVHDSGFGPVLADVATRVYCELVDAAPQEAGWFLLARGRITRVDLEADPVPPLASLRGSYATVTERRPAP